MIEKPNISNEKIVASLDENYSLKANAIEFLPIGNDASAWAYRVYAKDQNTYFLKIRKELSNPAGVLVPYYLQEHGIRQSLSPLPTKGQELWIHVEDFFLVLYPFVAGKEAMEVGMSDLQWIEFGSVLQRIHRTELPARVSQSVRRETFIPKWSDLAKDLHQRINTQNFDDVYQKELAAYWKGNNKTIQILVERTEMIGTILQQKEMEFVLCHADIHTANILITHEQDMFLVDWDDTLLAPKERDLMFVLGEDTIQTREEQLFFDGYGTVDIDQLVLAYYRYEWCVQEIGDFGKRVFLMNDLGKDTKHNAVDGFIQLFSPGDVIEAALQTPLEYEIRNNS